MQWLTGGFFTILFLTVLDIFPIVLDTFPIILYIFPLWQTLFYLIRTFHLQHKKTGAPTDPGFPCFLKVFRCFLRKSYLRRERTPCGCWL